MTVAPSDRRAKRRDATRAEIVDAAWGLVREVGLAGMTVRDLAGRVGMSAPSIYSYFGSKHDIYDEMFRQGYVAFAEWMDQIEPLHAKRPSVAERRALLARIAHRYVEFCTSDPVRFQLLFQRTIPDFVPSPDSYAVAVDAYERGRVQAASIGVGDQATLDLITAVLTGLASQQIANDPGGTRWTDLVDQAADLLLRAVSAPATSARGAKS
jgi:AcrR family transcriptional regulator